MAPEGAEAGRAAAAARRVPRPASWPGDVEDEAVRRLRAMWRPGRRGGAGCGLKWRRRWRRLRPLASADPAAAATVVRGSGGSGRSSARIRGG
uniref:Uncharacterized protein n=1 Tax=Oryza nivara TaxID=4536 RepID=A0A0E0HR68_ORYNI